MLSHLQCFIRVFSRSASNLWYEMMMLCLQTLLSFKNIFWYCCVWLVSRSYFACPVQKNSSATWYFNHANIELHQKVSKKTDPFFFWLQVLGSEYCQTLDAETIFYFFFKCCIVEQQNHNLHITHPKNRGKGLLSQLPCTNLKVVGRQWTRV